MGKKCPVVGCTTNYKSSSLKEKVPVYSFPSDKDKCREWVICLPNKLAVENVTGNMGVCALHWPKDIPLTRASRSRHLVPAVPPSIFPNVPQSCIPTSSQTTPRPTKKATQTARAIKVDQMGDFLDQDTIKLDCHSGQKQKKGGKAHLIPLRSFFIIWLGVFVATAFWEDTRDLPARMADNRPNQGSSKKQAKKGTRKRKRESEDVEAENRKKFKAERKVRRGWSPRQVQGKLKEKKLPKSVVDKFKKKEIDGDDLENLKFDDLGKMRLSGLECHKVREVLEEMKIWQPAPMEYKIFNDPIHGNIQLHPACVAIMNTPEFQRLRFLKQLGLCYYVYPGASHNRFEHCIGVSYLAGEFVRSLRHKQPYLGITDVDVLCVEIAGLVHDLGHGPFSHAFDGKFIPKTLERAGQVEQEDKWTHEKASQELFDHLIKENKLRTELKRYGLKSTDFKFIKELIDNPSKPGKECKGRTKEKAYLYEIVANKRNGIDVDKWDYLARDCHQLGITNNFDHRRYIKFARVIEVDGEWQICIRDKEAMNLHNMFANRYNLTKTAYQHRVVCAMDEMVVEALLEADKHFKIKGKDGEKCTISGCIKDMTAYTNLTDNVLVMIHNSEDEKLKKAQDIIKRIFRRDLYTCVAESKPLWKKEAGPQNPAGCGRPEDDFLKTLEKMLPDLKEDIWSRAGKDQFGKDDIFVTVVRLDFGRKAYNPLDQLNTYTKRQPDKAKCLSSSEISSILSPFNFQECIVRAFSRIRSAPSKLELNAILGERSKNVFEEKLHKKTINAHAKNSCGVSYKTWRWRLTGRRLPSARSKGCLILF